jgi:site-specific DNA-methyltransferase (adenine-specific)
MNSQTFLGDSTVLMRAYSAIFFDLAHVDPPYFSGPEKRRYYGKKVSSTRIKRRDYKVIETWEIPNKSYFDELFRTSKNQIIWGANYFTFKNINPFKTPRRKDIDQFIIDNPIGWIVWDKCNGASSFNDYELAWTSFERPTFVYKFMWNGMMQGLSELQDHIMQGNKKLNQKRIHPTEKPIKLYRYITSNYANEGDVILDTHLGSGSHRLAIHSMMYMRLKFYGMEKSRFHFLDEQDRFSKLTRQESLNL